MKLISTYILIFFYFCFGNTKLPSRQVSFDIIYTITLEQKAPASVELTSLIPVSIPDRQTIQSVEYSVEPVKVFDDSGNRYARFYLSDFTGETNITVSVRAMIYRYDLETALKQSNASELNEEERTLYTRSEKYIEVDNQLIQETSKRLKGDTDLETVRSCFNFVSKELTYAGYVYDDMGAVETLQKKRADCDGYVSLFTALVRACGIPVKYVEGIVLNNKKDLGHGWAEAYLEDKGWVPVDLNYGQINRKENMYLEFSALRIDYNLDSYHFYVFKSFGKKIAIKKNFVIIR